MEQDQKLKSSLRLPLNRSGQAVVELILLCVITVALALGMRKGFQNLNSFMSSYVGDYIACLMEYGELPTNGISESGLKKHASLGGSGGKTCDTKFEGFTFTNGRPPTGGSGGGSSKTTTANGKGNNSQAANGGKGQKSSSSKDESSEKDGKGSALPYAKGQISRGDQRGTSDGGDTSNKKVKIIEEDEEAMRKKSKAYGANSRRGSSRSSDKYNYITGEMAEKIEKNARRLPRTPSSSVRTISDGDSRFKPYKKTFTPPAAKKVVETDNLEGSQFGFGGFLRWIIIGAMILAIIVFFGGQVMNYNNSQD